MWSVRKKIKLTSIDNLLRLEYTGLTSEKHIINWKPIIIFIEKASTIMVNKLWAPIINWNHIPTDITIKIHPPKKVKIQVRWNPKQINYFLSQCVASSSTYETTLLIRKNSFICGAFEVKEREDSHTLNCTFLVLFFLINIYPCCQ